MSGVGNAALAIWVDIDPADDTLFEHWHSREHVQERVACPGWLRGSRFKGVDRPGRYLLFYDAETLNAFESDAYYARLGDPSAMSRVIFPKFHDTWRLLCSVEQRRGDGIDAAVLTLRMKAGNTAPFEKLAALETVRVDLLAGHADVGQAPTTEKGSVGGAGQPDRAGAGRLLLVGRGGAVAARAGGLDLCVEANAVEGRSARLAYTRTHRAKIKVAMLSANQAKIQQKVDTSARMME